MSDLEFSSGRYTKIASYKFYGVKAENELEAKNLVKRYITEEEVKFGGSVEVMCERDPFVGYDCIGLVIQNYSFS